MNADETRISQNSELIETEETALQFVQCFIRLIRVHPRLNLRRSLWVATTPTEALSVNQNFNRAKNKD